MKMFTTILRAIWSRRWVLLASSLLSMGMVYWLTRGMISKYRTEARLFINLQESKGTSLADEDLKQYQVATYFQNTTELLRSRRTLEKVGHTVLRDAILGKSPLKWDLTDEERSTFLARLDTLDALGEFLVEKKPDDARMINFLNHTHTGLDELRSSILAYRIQDSHFLRIEFTSYSPELTVYLTQVFIQSLIEENRDLSRNKIKGQKDIIEELVSQAKKDLDAKIKRLELYKVSNHIINLGEHTKAIVVYLVQLEGQRANLLSKVASGTKGRSEVLEAVRNGNEITLDLATHEEVVVLKKRLTDLNHQLLTRSLEDQNPVDQSVIESNIRNTRHQIEAKLVELSKKTPFDPSRLQLDLATKYVGYDLEAETAAHMVPVYDQEIARVTQYAKRFAPFESTIGAFEQEISTAQNVYLTLLNKLNLTESLEYGSGQNVIEVIDAPTLPKKPEASKRIWMVGAAGFAVVVIGLVVIIIFSLLDRRVKSIEEFQAFFPVPVIAAIPASPAKPKKATDALKVQGVANAQILKLCSSLISNPAVGQVVLASTGCYRDDASEVVVPVAKWLSLRDKRVAIVDADWTRSRDIAGAISWKDRLAEAGLVAEAKALRDELVELRKEYDLILLMVAPMAHSGEEDFWLRQVDSVVHVFACGRTLSSSDYAMPDVYQRHAIRVLGATLIHFPVDQIDWRVQRLTEPATQIQQPITQPS